MSYYTDQSSYNSYSSTGNLAWNIFSVALGWVSLYLFLYFAVQGGTFASVNPILLYWIPASVMAIFSGLVGQNLENFLFTTVTGVKITLKDVGKGVLYGLPIGTAVVLGMFALGPVLSSITGLNITGLRVSASVDPVPLFITNLFGIVPTTDILQSLINLITSYVFWLMLVVAASEEFLVYMTFKPFESLFLKDLRISLIIAIVLATLMAGIFWGLAHAPAYSLEGVPVVMGIISAILIGTVFFRILSQIIFGYMNLSFMASAHFAYDYVLATVIVSLSFIPLSWI